MVFPLFSGVWDFCKRCVSVSIYIHNHTEISRPSPFLSRLSNNFDQFFYFFDRTRKPLDVEKKSDILSSDDKNTGSDV